MLFHYLGWKCNCKFVTPKELPIGTNFRLGSPKTTLGLTSYVLEDYMYIEHTQK